MSLPTRDVLMAIAWLAANGFVMRTAWHVVGRLFPEDAAVTRVFHCCVLAIGLIIVTLTAIGAAGLLSGPVMVIGVPLVAGLMRCGVDRSWFPLTIAVAGSDIGSASRDNEVWPPYPGWLWGSLAAVFAGHVIYHGLLRFPTDYDCLWYHLPLIDYWLQSGSLYAPNCARWFFPANSELLGLWMTGAMSGDFLAPLNNVPVVLLWALAGGELYRRASAADGITRSLHSRSLHSRSLHSRSSHSRSVADDLWCSLAVIAMLSVFTTWHETDDASNDLMVVACCLAAVVYSLRYSADGRRADFVFAGLCIGLLAGVKHFAVGYACANIVLLGILLRMNPERCLPLRTMFMATLVAVPFGGYWYLRNWLVTGHAFDPAEAGSTHGLVQYPNLAATTLLLNPSPDVLRLALAAVVQKCGPIHVVAVLMLPVILIGLAIKGSAVLPIRRQPARTALLLCIPGSLLILLLTPYCVEDQPGTLNHLRWAYTPVRYGLCYLSFSVIGLFVVVHRAWTVCLPAMALSTSSAPVGLCPAGRVTIRNVVSGLWLTFVAGLTAWQFVRHLIVHSEFDFAMAAIVGFDAAALWLMLSWMIHRLSHRAQVCAVFALLGCAGLLVWPLSHWWHDGYSRHFAGYRLHDSLPEFRDDAAVGHRLLVLDHRVYPFLGSHRQYRVVQPAGFDDAETIASLMDAAEIGYAVSRSRPGHDVFVYEAASTVLPDAAGFEVIRRQSNLTLFRRTVPTTTDLAGGPATGHDTDPSVREQ